MNSYTESKLINLSSESANHFYNTTYLSHLSFNISCSDKIPSKNKFSIFDNDFYFRPTVFQQRRRCLKGVLRKAAKRLKSGSTKNTAASDLR